GSAAPAADRLAPTDEHADGTDPAVPARRRRGAGVTASAASAQSGQDEELHRLARRLGTLSRRDRDVRRLRFGLVRRDLPAADPLADRLPDPADPTARARDRA